MINSKGCDSVVTLNLTILNSTARTWYQPRTICNGAAYTFNGNTYITTGNYRDTLISTSGMKDSIIVTQLTVYPTYSVNNPRTICNGGVYTFNGKNYTTAGTYRDTLSTINGCDSIIVTQLTVNPVYSVNNPRTICNGGVYTFNGKNYTTAGTYRDTLSTINGCDSIIVTLLTVNPKPITSSISGVVVAGFNSVETYSVTPTVNSSYNWIITNGTQISGGNTHSITVQWGSTIVFSSVRVVETNSFGCNGDTVAQIVTLPVGMISFEAQKVNDDALLKWSTSTEMNNRGFEIQRSFDGRRFDSIGFVTGKINSTVRNDYQYTDNTVFRIYRNTPVIFYRLKQIDLDGQYEHTSVVSINNPYTNFIHGVTVIAYPSPFKNEFNLQVNSESEAVAKIRVFDLHGKQVREFNQQIQSGELVIPVQQTDDWESGMYTVTITINNQTYKVRLLKQH